MATPYTWPASLPQSPRVDFSETGGVLVLRTPMDKGPPKQRRLGVMTKPMRVSWTMTDAQVAILETFVEDTIKGVYRFAFPHPRTGATIEARIVPAEDGALYTATWLAPGYYTVAMTIEDMP